MVVIAQTNATTQAANRTDETRSCRCVLAGFWCAKGRRIEQYPGDCSTRGDDLRPHFGLRCIISSGLNPTAPLRKLSIATVALLGIVVSAQRTEAQGLTFSLFERYLESFRVEASIPALSATVLQNGSIVWERGFGKRDVESGAPATPDTPYLIGGLSQMFG